jgi:glycosyltransferase involved in cell wall biosynthesis
LEGVAWLDDDTTAAGEVAIVAGKPQVGECRRSIDVAVDLLADGVDRVVLLWVGAVAVLGSLDALVNTAAQPMTLVVRATDGLPDDGLAPTEADLMGDGLYSTTVAAFSAEAEPVLNWLSSNLRGDVEVGDLLTRAAQLFGVAECTDESIGVGRWRWNCTEPALLDLGAYDTRSPWTLDPEEPRPLRIELLGHPDRQAALSAAAPQLVGRRTPLCLPGGLEVDAIVRQVVAHSSTSAPAPWSAAAEFRDWLALRYWGALHEKRRDLGVAFPDPEQRSAELFRQWCRSAFSFDDIPLLIDAPAVERNPLVVADQLRDDGLNLVGYLTRQSGLGDVARRLRDALGQAGLAYSAIATQRTASPTSDSAEVGNRVEFTNSVCVVNADQFPFLADDYRDLFSATQRMIGYWFWELEHIPLHMRRSIALVDEIWAGSRFVTDAFAAVASIPVRHVPIPVAEPLPSPRGRGDFAALTDAGERPVLVAVFDHFSVTERKNPIGVIDAFRLAFAPGVGPILIIKTMNGRKRWANHQRVLAAADGRDDIRVWDETLSRADQMALVAAADCMISLHRSEGLGLHLAEAMWLGTPVIATGYSGNLDFMNDDNSLLIDFELVNVEHGEGVYPSSAKWAAPDLQIAAAAMRRIASDPALCARLAAAGRRTMEQQPSLADTGRLVKQLLLGGE